MRTIIEQYFDNLWSRGEVEVADTIIHPDYDPEWIQIEKSGPEQLKHEVNYFRSVFSEVKYEIVDSVECEDKAWVRYQESGTHSKKAWGFAPTNKRFQSEGVTIFTLKDDKIIDRWGSFCFYDIFHSLGLVPPWWELSKLSEQSDGDKEIDTN
jgi:hypothetical protein